LAWTIEYAETAVKQLRKLDRAVARRIADYLDRRIASGADPRSAGKALRGPLGDLWAYRLGDYRILCDIQDDAVRVLVLQIGNRREIYH